MISHEFWHIACPCCWNVVCKHLASVTGSVFNRWSWDLFVKDSIPTRPRCPLVELSDVRKVSCICEGGVCLCRPQGGPSLRLFLQVGHSGLWGYQSFTFHILSDTIIHLLTVFQYNICWVFWSFDHYLTWCSSVCRWEKCNLIKFNNLRQPNVKKLWGLNAFFKGTDVLYMDIGYAWILFFIFLSHILSTWCDILFSPTFISKGTTVSYAIFIYIRDV